MKIIKEICVIGPRVGVVRSDCYGSALTYIQSLVAIAREHFPDLLDEQVKIQHYDDRTFGIEFPIPDNTPTHEEWVEVSRLKCIL